jgi:DNA-binding NarL/FixJ family response regulator
VSGEPGAPASVLVVDDHELLAHTIRVALSGEGVEAVLAPPVSVPRVLAAVERVRPRLVLLDLDLGPPIGDGGTLVAPLVRLGSRVLVVTGVSDRTRVAAAVESGAVGWVPKAAPFPRLLEVVREALAGRPVLSEPERFELLALLRRRRADELTRREPFERLTPREQQVLRQLAEGRTVDAIAREGRVSPSTVRTQVRGILTKLGVRTQLAAVAQARAAGWITGAGEPVG